jgi:predicted nucleic-acid-binding protein
VTVDDPAQVRQAIKVMEEAVHTREPLYLSLVVLCEAVWVLRSFYRHTRHDISGTLERMLGNEALAIEDANLVSGCLDQYRHGRGDFSDYVIGALAQQAGCSLTYTFDRNLRGAAGFHVL